MEICHRVDRTFVLRKRFRRRLSSTLKDFIITSQSSVQYRILFVYCFLFQQVAYVPKSALSPSGRYGVSLLSPAGRTWFVQMMSCIRAEILTRVHPEALKWESDADDEDHDPEEL